MARFPVSFVAPAGVALLALSGCQTTSASIPKGSPNVVIIFTDDQGFGDLSCYGHPTIHTPHIDQLAADGAKLTQFYVASPVCSPSRAALLTGCYPKRVGMHKHVIFPQYDYGLHTDEVTIADMLREHVAAKWECAPEDVLFADSEVIKKQDTAERMSFSDAVWLAEAAEGPLVRSGGYKTPKLGGDYRGGTIGASPAYSFTVHIAEVTVDEETGFVKVEKVWAAHDCGKALNPIVCEGQIQGSVYMGLGEVLLEQQIYDDEGRLICPNLVDYKIPTAVDTPEIEALLIESNDAEGPFGAKEAGEGPLHPIIPAVANAVYDAVGIRLRTIPFHPSQVLEALEAQQASNEEAR